MNMRELQVILGDIIQRYHKIIIISLIVIIMAGGFFITNKNTYHTLLFYPDENKMSLIAEKREIINHGKGIIMKEYQINEGEAYQKLRKLRMDNCLNLVDISKKIIAQHS